MIYYERSFIRRAKKMYFICYQILEQAETILNEMTNDLVRKKEHLSNLSEV